MKPYEWQSLPCVISKKLNGKRECVNGQKSIF